jgi:hypothetical protein
VYPGDVCVRSQEDSSNWEKAFEVRDKPVTETDVRIFGKKCVDMGVREAAVLMASDAQQRLDVANLGKWAQDFGLGLTLFHGWPGFIEQALFWSEQGRLGASGASAVTALVHPPSSAKQSPKRKRQRETGDSSHRAESRRHRSRFHIARFRWQGS